MKVRAPTDSPSIADAFRSLPGLERMGDPERAALAGHFEHVDYRDEWICREGDPAEFLYVLAGGTLEIVKRSPSGREFAVARLTPTCLFGHVALVTPHSSGRVASVRAAGDAVVYRMAKLRMQVLLRSTDFELVSPFRRALIVGLARQLHAANESLVSLAIESGAAETVEPMEGVDVDPTDAERRLLEAQSLV